MNLPSPKQIKSKQTLASPRVSHCNSSVRTLVPDADTSSKIPSPCINLSVKMSHQSFLNVVFVLLALLLRFSLIDLITCTCYIFSWNCWESLWSAIVSKGSYAIRFYFLTKFNCLFIPPPSSHSDPPVHNHTAGPVSPGGSHSRLPLRGKWLPPAGDCLDTWGQPITPRPPSRGPVFWYSAHHAGGSPWRGPVRVPGGQPCGNRAHRCAAEHPAERWGCRGECRWGHMMMTTCAWSKSVVKSHYVSLHTCTAGEDPPQTEDWRMWLKHGCRTRTAGVAAKRPCSNTPWL